MGRKKEMYIYIYMYICIATAWAFLFCARIVKFPNCWFFQNRKHCALLYIELKLKAKSTRVG